MVISVAAVLFLPQLEQRAFKHARRTEVSNVSERIRLPFRLREILFGVNRLIRRVVVRVFSVFIEEEIDIYRERV